MDINTRISKLTDKEKREFREALNLEFEDSLEQKLNDGVTCCPNCKSEQYRKVGKTRGVQRYKCKFCNKTFGATNNTPFYRTQKELATWNLYLDLMFSGPMSIRKIADQVGIYYRTAFHWRHKILNALKQIDSSKLSGIVEADETYFPLSYKGKKRGMPRRAHKRGSEIRVRGISKQQVCVLTAIDRSQTKNMLLQSTCLARPTAKQITDTLGPHIATDAILLTDEHRSYLGFARDKNLKHYALKHREPQDRSLHLQNVNSLHSQVKRFMRPFNGVATKYLDSYMIYYKWTGQDVAPVLAQPTASVTCNELTAMQMHLK